MDIEEILAQLTLRNDKWRNAIWADADVEPNWVEVAQLEGYQDCLRDIAKALGMEQL